MNGGQAPRWREVVDKHCAALVDELARRLDSELDAARDQTARETRISTTESLNQALRRTRLAPSESAVLAILLDAAASHAASVVVLRVESNQVQLLDPGTDGSFAFALETAPAVASVCESREPVVALASAGELTADLAEALSPGDSSRKAYLFPVIARLDVVAVLIAVGDPSAGALELLSEAAGMKIEALESAVAVLKPLPNPELVHIMPPAVPETSGTERIAWADLSVEDQKLHLQAQRVARVKVAEMRLNHAEELRRGVFEGDIYGALRTEIDIARGNFLKSFLSRSRTMVDYLHLEILRSLAHEDDRLLGHEYPGPMV